MATVIPFRGILYNPDKISGDEVTAPPLHIIAPEYREGLYEKSRYNIVRIDFGKEMPDDSSDSNKYTRSGSYLEKWLQEGVLVRDDKPSFYFYEITYQLSGERKILRGILALVKIEDLGKGVYPHEATHSKPKADRLDLMRSCLANISPIYSLYNSPAKVTSRIIEDIEEAPYLTAHDSDGATHKLYKISDETQIQLITAELCDKPIFIADGHHRYEVALEFRNEMRRTMDSSAGLQCPGQEQKPWDYVMMFLANMADAGISVLPTHRMVKGIFTDDILGRLEQDFIVRQMEVGQDISKVLSKEGRNSFGLYLDSEKKWYVLKYRGADLGDIHDALKGLDVVILHELILKRDLGITDVAYEMDENEAIRRVSNGDFDAAFFLNPTGVEDVERVAMSNMRMPPKSTYFYPKLLTGMVIYKYGG